MANKEHLGLEFNININKQSVTKFIDTENESALEELNQLPLDQTFEYYFAHQESFK